MQGTDVLYPGVEVDGYKVEPWGLGEIEKLVPVFARVYAEMHKIPFAVDKDGKKETLIDHLMKEENLIPMILALLPEVKTVLCVTLNEKPETVEKFKVDQVIRLVLTIVNQNVGYLKNSFGPLSAVVKDLTATA